MKKVLAAVAIVGVTYLAIDNLVEKCKAHKNYRKGWNDGAEFACALKDLEHTLDKILNKS